MNKDREMAVIVSCEHAGNQIPDIYAHLFASEPAVFDTHRSYDIGAADLARRISGKLSAPLFIWTYSRLLADVNRHGRHRHVFSKFTRDLDEREKAHILNRYHAPYRKTVEDEVRREIDAGRRVLHLSIHSFTPVLNGVTRTADIGFLYDPKRDFEQRAVAFLIKHFKENASRLRLRRNYPYLGVSDSLTTYLRKQFSGNVYAGIEIEVNQRFALETPPKWPSFRDKFAKTLVAAVTGLQ